VLHRQARLLAALALVLSSAVACSLVLPFGELQTGSTGSGGGSTTSSSGSGGGCSHGEKRCGDRCVPRTLTKYGCGAESCDACQPSSGADAVCVDEVCQNAPKELAAKRARPFAVTVAESYVYWTEEGTGDAGVAGGVYRIQAVGGGVEPVADAAGAHAIALDETDTTVLFTTSSGSAPSGLWHAPKTGGGKTNLETTKAADQVGSIAVTDHVYWAEEDSGLVYRDPIASSSPVVIFDAGASHPHSVVHHGNYLYLSLYGAKRIARVNDDGSAGYRELWTSMTSRPEAIAVDDAGVYFNSVVRGEVLAIALDGVDQNATVVQENSAHLSAIATDATYVYWADAGGDEPAPSDCSPPAGTIARRRKDGSAPMETLVHPTYPVAIAVSPEALYYLEGSAKDCASGRVMQIYLQ
jgi:hypothetical protein